MRRETEPVEEAEDEWAGSDGLVGRSVDTVMRVRVTKNRREDFLLGRDELVLEGGTASSGELSVRLEARIEDILRISRERMGEKGERRKGWIESRVNYHVGSEKEGGDIV